MAAIDPICQPNLSSIVAIQLQVRNFLSFLPDRCILDPLKENWVDIDI